mmetsp:Transcript_71101/g.158042  ORF Transcript_71101/g.158042 Transcript_71101/m.158042 type:complete len:344 (-) Transcript_71101:593-1624(-)
MQRRMCYSTRFSGQTMLIVTSVLQVLAWNANPDPKACASWCKWSDDNCVQPFKKDQCKGCSRCTEVNAKQEAAAAVAKQAELAMACKAPNHHPSDSARRECEWWCAPADREYDCHLCFCQECAFCGGTLPVPKQGPDGEHAEGPTTEPSAGRDVIRKGASEDRHKREPSGGAESRDRGAESHDRGADLKQDHAPHHHHGELRGEGAQEAVPLSHNLTGYPGEVGSVELQSMQATPAEAMPLEAMTPPPLAARGEPTGSRGTATARGAIAGDSVTRIPDVTSPQIPRPSSGLRNPLARSRLSTDQSTNDYPVPVLVAAMLALSLGGGVAVGRLISAIRQVVSRR